MGLDKFNDLCKRFGKLNIDGMDKGDQMIFLMAFASFLTKIEPLLDEYAPKEPKKAKKPKKPAEKYYKFGIDGRIEPLE